jgi:hypothetical protein
VIHTEESVGYIQQLIKEAVHDELRHYDKSDQMSSLLGHAQSEIGDRIANLENRFAESHRKTQKLIKKLKVEVELAKTQPDDDERPEEIAMQINEMKRRQNMMLELINAMRVHSDQDFDQVNTHLAGLWDQLSLRRGDSPLRLPQ